ncbi:MAG TPA: SRPBCC domain-containing protein [Candidatus Limnocylindrales bacterium]|jgi:uncharacterized protein YndB with AHSA1/START domain
MQPTEPALGSFAKADDRGVLRIEERYDTDVNDLWSAITEPARLARWFGKIDGDLRPGGRFNLSAEWDGGGRVEECEAPRRLRVTVRESDESYRQGNGVPPFDSSIEATLTPDGDQTVLVAVIKGMPLDKIQFYGVGWQINAEKLGSYIGGREIGDTELRWEELLPAYVALADELG